MDAKILNKDDIIKDRYKILSLIGKGGIGTTYRVRDIEKDRIVVLKILNLRDVKDWKEIELFEREISTLKNIQHPYIPDYYDNFKLQWHNETFYALIMEYIDGKNLHDSVKEGYHFTFEQVKTILGKLLSILSYIHNLNPPVIHRDINPKNIIHTPDGNIFLVDFGAVGRLVRDTIAASVSNTFVGTIGYMPPEQLYGKALPGSDIYSLGVSMLFLLSGKDPASFNIKDLRLDYRSFINLPDNFRHIIDKMIEPVIERRFQSAEEVLILLNKKKVQKKKIRKEKKKKEKEVFDTMSGPFDVDRMIEIKRKKENARERAIQIKENRLKEKKREKELREIAVAEQSPRRVFINETDEAVMISVKKIPFLTRRIMGFKGDVLTSLLLFVASSAFLGPMTIGTMHDLKIAFIPGNPIADGIIILSLYLVLIFLGVIIYSILAGNKSYTLLLTDKENVLIYRKNPRKPIVMGRKKQLSAIIRYKAFRPGGGGSISKAWRGISFILADREFKDNGFKPQDADRVYDFCKKHQIKVEKYE